MADEDWKAQLRRRAEERRAYLERNPPKWPEFKYPPVPGDKDLRNRRPWPIGKKDK
jgi:hypothetical protein